MVTNILDPYKQEIFQRLNDFIWTCQARCCTQDSVAIFRKQYCTSTNLYELYATYR